MNDPFLNPTSLVPKVRYTYAAGAAADANIAVPGISPGGHDRVLQVIGAGAIIGQDLSDEVSITDDDVIQLADTVTTGITLLVVWYDHDWGEKVDTEWIDDDV